MSRGRKAWNAWDVPYFAATRRAQAEPGATTADLQLADGGGRIAGRVLAVLIGIGAVFAGLAVVGGLLLITFVFSFGDSPDAADIAIASALGGLVAVCGLAMAVMTYREAGRPRRVRLTDDRLEISYPTFKTPFVVERSMVRVVAVDDARVVLFTNNARFPIDGVVAAHAFADALDNWPAGPWEDMDPDRRGPFPSTPPVVKNVFAAATPGYAHDEPDRAGWASGSTSTSAIGLAREAHLWSAAGSSLPFLRLRPIDVPNLAILFHEPLRPPRPAWWFGLSPAHGRFTYLRRGRAVRGLLLRVRDATAAERAFDGWRVLRRVTADDVVTGGLLVAKPLTGVRALAYGAIVLGSILIEVVSRMLR